MKKYLTVTVFLFFTFLFLNLTNYKVLANDVLSDHNIIGQINTKTQLEYINEDMQYLFIPTNQGIFMADPNTLEVENKIDIIGNISNYAIIDNIEGDNKPNKDLIIFVDDEALPSIIVYSLDSYDQIWSYTIFSTFYNNESIKIDIKMPVFDYVMNNNTILLVSDYQLYNLNLHTGELNWVYDYTNNIWSVSFMGDINNDNIEDIAISVQPSDVLGLDGSDGKVLWKNKVAKSYQIKRDNKVIGTSERNIWDIMLLNSNLILTGEDGYIYQINPSSGNIIKEKKILDKIPNILTYSIYLEDNKVKEYSGLSVNGNSAYKIINIHESIDSNNDQVKDLIVTIFEPNKHALFSNINSSIYLLDGKTLEIIWEKPLEREQIFNLNLYSNGDISYFDGTSINVFNVTDFENEKNVLVDLSNNPESLYPLSFDDKLIINNNNVIQIIDITDISNPLIISSLNYFDGYDTVSKNGLLYKIYYKFDEQNNMNKNYKTIECENTLNETLWSYDLENNVYFNKYHIQTIDNKNVFYFISNDNQLRTIDENGNVYSLNMNIDIDPEIEPNYKKANVLTESPDYNQDGYNDIFIVFDDGQLLVLNSRNVDEIIYSYNLNSLFDDNWQNFTHAFPLFTEDNNEIAVISNKNLIITSFNENMDSTIIKDIDFDKFNFWDDGQAIKNSIDLDNDGYNDYILRLSSNDENKALIIQTGSGKVGSFLTGWDFTVYPTDDLNNDGINEVIVTTNKEDKEDNWLNVSEIINPTGDDDVLFSKVFYEGNEYTYNSQYKPLAVVNDLTGDGYKDVIVLMDRWGDSYIQVYSLDDDKTVKKVIPLNARFIEKNDMLSETIGAPGGFIDTFTFKNTDYMLITLFNERDSITSVLNFEYFPNMQRVANITGRLHDYSIFEDKLLFYFRNNKNEDNYRSLLLDVTLNSTVKNLNENQTYKNPNIKINLDKNSNVAFFRIYIDGKLVEVTNKEEINLFLQDGINQVGIGEVLENNTELITYYDIHVKSDDSLNNYLLIYTFLITGVVFLLPLKMKKLKRRG